jgi:hypothetical protein
MASSRELMHTRGDDRIQRARPKLVRIVTAADVRDAPGFWRDLTAAVHGWSVDDGWPSWPPQHLPFRLGTTSGYKEFRIRRDRLRTAVLVCSEMA